MAESQKHLLLVDDEAALREAIAERLADHGFVVEQAASGEEALAAAGRLRLRHPRSPTCGCPASTAAKVLDAALERYPEIIAIVITGFGTVKDAVERDQAGRRRLHHQAVPVRRAAARAATRRSSSAGCKSENAYLRSQLEDRYRIDGLVGRSRVMRDLFQLLETVAATSSTVLITGETGTGKELAARAIHHSSPRRAQPVRRDQLQRDSRNAARGGALRPRARRVHRRGRQRARAGSSRRTRARCSSTKSGR